MTRQSAQRTVALLLPVLVPIVIAFLLLFRVSTDLLDRSLRHLGVPLVPGPSKGSRTLPPPYLHLLITLVIALFYEIGDTTDDRKAD